MYIDLCRYGSSSALYGYTVLKVTELHLKVAMVQCYIHHFADVEVRIKQPKNFKDIKLLDRMYNKAKELIWQKQTI